MLFSSWTQVLEATADLAGFYPDYFVACFEASHKQMPPSVIGQLNVSTLSFENTRLDGGILSRKVARVGDTVEVCRFCCSFCRFLNHFII